MCSFGSEYYELVHPHTLDGKEDCTLSQLFFLLQGHSTAFICENTQKKYIPVKNWSIGSSEFT